MGNFIDRAVLSRYYYIDRAFGIINVGYNDFAVVKPETTFRTQKFYTWHFVISGGGTLEIYGQRYEIHGGQAFFIPPHTKMRYFPHPDDPWEYVWFAIKGGGDRRICRPCWICTALTRVHRARL